MKRRQGFVSNSSSSSFIINIGVVTDMDKFQETMKEYNVTEDTYDLIFINGMADYFENHSRGWGNPFDGGDWAGNYFDEKEVIKIWEKDPFATIVVKTEYGGDDSDFSIYDDDGNWLDIDYDLVELEWFSNFDQFLYSEADEKKHGINIIHSHYGAGRDG